MTKEKIKIKHITIGLYSKEFSYYNGHDKDRSIEEKKVYDKELKEFRKNKVISHEETSAGYTIGTEVYYYEGFIEFLPVKKDGSSIKMDVKLPQDSINSVAAMCLDSVCDICEKQTKAFQNTFVDFVKENSDAITNQAEKIKQNLITRSVNKVLSIGGKVND